MRAGIFACMSSINHDGVDYDPLKYVPLPEAFLEEIDQPPRVNGGEAKARDTNTTSRERAMVYHHGLSRFCKSFFMRLSSRREWIMKN